MPKPPAFDTLWSNYPEGTSPDVRKTIGGEVDNDDYANTCAIRVSRALNYSGQPIKKQKGLYSVKGADKKWYALRMKELTEYLKKKWGKPQVAVKKPKGDSSKFDGKKGVISFLGIPGYSGGGHIDLWDGSATKTGVYFESGEVLLWVAPEADEPKPDVAEGETMAETDDSRPPWELEPDEQKAQEDPPPDKHPAKGTPADPAQADKDEAAEEGSAEQAAGEDEEDDDASSSAQEPAQQGAAPAADPDPPFFIPPGETIEVAYEVLSQPPPATKSVAEVYKHGIMGDPLETKTLVTQGGSTLALPLSGRTIDDSPLWVRFIFENEKAIKKRTTVDRVFALGEPEAGVLTVAADAKPGGTAKLEVTGWGGNAYDQPGRATYFPDPLPDSRVPSDAKQDVKWRIGGRLVEELTGHSVDWTVPDDAPTGEEVLIEAFRREPEGPAAAQAKVKLGRVVIHGAASGTQRPPAPMNVPLDGTVRFKASIDPDIPGTWAWSCESDKVQLTPSGSGRSVKVKGLTESEADGDVTLKATLTSTATGVAYEGEWKVTVKPGLAIKAGDGTGDPSKFVPLWHAQTFKATVPAGWKGEFRWKTTSQKLRLKNAKQQVVTVIGRKDHSDGLDAETLEVTFTPADGSEAVTVSHTVAVIRVIFSAAEGQKYGFDNMNFTEAPRLSVRKSDSTTVRVRIQGGATTDDLKFTTDDATTADATAPAAGETELDLTVNGKAKNKGVTLVRARLDSETGPTCSWPLSVHVYKQKDITLTVYHVEDSTSEKTKLSRVVDLKKTEEEINRWYRSAVAKVRVEDGGKHDVCFDLNDNGALEVTPGAGATDEEAAVKAVATAPGKKAVIVKRLTWFFKLAEEAKKGATKVKVDASLSGSMKYLEAGDAVTLGGESFTVQGKSGMEVTLSGALASDHPETEGLIMVLNGLSGNPVWIKEDGLTEQKQREVIGHETGHEQLDLSDLDDGKDTKKLLMHYTGQERTGTRIRYLPQPTRYDAGVKENQWDLVPRD